MASARTSKAAGTLSPLTLIREMICIQKAWKMCIFCVYNIFVLCRTKSDCANICCSFRFDCDKQRTTEARNVDFGSRS